MYMKWNSSESWNLWRANDILQLCQASLTLSRTPPIRLHQIPTGEQCGCSANVKCLVNVFSKISFWINLMWDTFHTVQSASVSGAGGDALPVSLALHTEWTVRDSWSCLMSGQCSRTSPQSQHCSPSVDAQLKPSKLFLHFKSSGLESQQTHVWITYRLHT